MLSRIDFAEKIASMYSIQRSTDVAGSVCDYLIDRGVELSLDDFRVICFHTAKKAGVMQPSIKQAKDQFENYLRILEESN